MGFLKKLFGGGKGSEEYVDKRGVYFYVRCDNCGIITRIRADKEYDLTRVDNGYSWHKTIVDNRCFRPMPAVVQLDAGYQPSSMEISGGSFASEEEYSQFLASDVSAEPDDVVEPTDQESVE